MSPYTIFLSDMKLVSLKLILTQFLILLLISCSFALDVDKNIILNRETQAKDFSSSTNLNVADNSAIPNLNQTVLSEPETAPAIEYSEQIHEIIPSEKNIADDVVYHVKIMFDSSGRTDASLNKTVVDEKNKIYGQEFAASNEDPEIEYEVIESNITQLEKSAQIQVAEEVEPNVKQVDLIEIEKTTRLVKKPNKYFSPIIDSYRMEWFSLPKKDQGIGFTMLKEFENEKLIPADSLRWERKFKEGSDLDMDEMYTTFPSFSGNGEYEHYLDYSGSGDRDSPRLNNKQTQTNFGNLFDITEGSGEEMDKHIRPFNGKCPKGYFLCNQTYSCQALSFRCNGIIDCPKAQDEINCPCAFFINKHKLCDGYEDCTDGSDEKYCEYCASREFNCGSGQCIEKNKICDMKQDCENGLDEMFCYKLNSNSILTNENPMVTATKGYLFQNFNGEWLPFCYNPYDSYLHDHLKYACSLITSNYISRVPFIFRKLNSTKSNDYYSFFFQGRHYIRSSCHSGMTVYLDCGEVKCGYSPLYHMKFSLQGKIVGGKSSTPESWPWHGGVYKNGEYICGATLINQNWMISAAHCFLNYRDNFFEVKLGVIRKTSQSKSPEIRSISAIVIHEYFDAISLKHDIALLKLEHPVMYSLWIRPVCLPKQGKKPSPLSHCKIIGWGHLGEDLDDSDQLHEVRVPILKHCPYGKGKLCAGFPYGGKDACQGDSGGSLLCLNNQENSWILEGIISSGKGCARPDSPGVYTKVSHYLNWIKNSMDASNNKINKFKPCPGLVCPVVADTNCLKPVSVCDGIVNCFDAKDESVC